MFNVEKGIITKILETRDFNTVKENQIKLNYFSGDSRSAFQYITEQVQTTGVTPTVRAFKKRFPKFSLDYIDVDGVDTVGNEESLLYWCNELRAKVKHNSIADTIDEAAKALGELNTEEAYNLIKKNISYIESEVVTTTAIDITNTQDRKDVYLNKKRTQGMSGIPTGFPYLDYLMKGLSESTLTTMIANTGVGKTMFECLLGANCMLEGYKVLQLITEMSDTVMRDRYEAILCAKIYGELNYNDFKSGKLSPKQEKQYFDFLEKDLPELTPLIIDVATSPMGVSALIDKYKPDIVLIDGVYLMEDDSRSDSDWLRVAHINRDLKKIAKRGKIPIFANSQADKNTSKKTGPELGSISYSQTIAQDSDNILALYRDQTMISDREMAVKILKQREGTLGKVMLNWDFEKMNFSEIYMEKDEHDNDNTIGVEDD